MPRPLVLCVLSACLLLAGCRPGRPAVGPAERLDIPAGPGSGQPHLHADEDGHVWLSWIEPVDTTRHALRYAAFDGAQWSDPATAAVGADWFVNWADVPSLRPLPDGRLAVHYLESGGPDAYAYDVRIAQTNGEGVWQPAVTPHRDGTETEHGFVSLLPWDGRLLAVWLDGRAMQASADGHGSGAMTLRSALLDPSGRVEQETLLDERTCECCPTNAVRTGDGVLVAYRDRSENEIRNIALVRYDGERWSAPYPLHDDGWQIHGCPVNGPALAADGSRVAAAWFTAPDNAPRVQVAFSEDGGRRFGAPIVVDDDGPIGRVDVVLLDDGSALVSWMGRDAEGTALRLRRVYADGSAGAPVSVAALSRSRGTGMPRMAHADGRLYLAWVDPGDAPDASRVRMARLAVDDVQ